MKKIDIKDLNINVYERIANDTMLITAGTKEKGYNTMTASWGEMGSLWGHGGGLPVSTIYIRPQRYTKQFVDNNDYYSLSFFPKGYEDDLLYLGTHSGKDEDKIAKTKLTAEFTDKVTYFKEANLVLICRKLYAQELKEECFIDKNVKEDSYPKKDFHTMYIGEIEEILIND